VRFESTPLAWLGRRVASYRCTVDLWSGRTVVERPGALDPVEQALWSSQAAQGLREGRRYEVVLEDIGPNERTRVLVRVTDGGTGELRRTIPVQEFRGFHDGAGVRALVLRDGIARFWTEFWILE
jgi:hypothetical protein